MFARQDIKTTMIYTNVMKKSRQAVQSLLDVCARSIAGMAIALSNPFPHRLPKLSLRLLLKRSLSIGGQ
ncbi:MAG: hypothetical protein WCA35_01910 [Kovacikia sp.]